MNLTARASYSNPTGDPSQLTALEIALSRCSWCPTALPDENDELVTVEDSRKDTHLFSDRDFRTAQTPPQELSDKAVHIPSDLQIGYESAVAV
jgi:hypothetical protein